MMIMMALDPSLLLRDADRLFINVVDSFDEITLDLLTQTGIYTGLANYAALVALGSMGYFSVQWVRKFMSNQQALTELVWPITVVFLFSNGGAPLAQLELGARSVGNQVIQGVLQESINGARLQNSLQDALMAGTAQDLLASLERICASQPESQRQTCRAQHTERLKKKLTRLHENFQERQELPSWQRYFERLGENFVGIVAWGSTAVVASFLYLGFTVMVWTLEVAMIVLMVTSPIALAFSLLPLPGRPLMAWISGFIGLIVAKIGLITSTAIVSSVVVSAAGLVNSMILPLFMTIGAPMIALMLGSLAGGGAFLSLTGVPLVAAQFSRMMLAGRR